MSTPKGRPAGAEGPEELSRGRKQKSGKKPFRKPELKKHKTLPEVTNGFAGTFSP